MLLSKKLKKASKEISHTNELMFDSEGNALISVKAMKQEQIFSEYDYDSGEKLNPTLSEYIWDKARFVPANKEIKLKVYTGSEVNKKDVESAIRNNFKKDFAMIKAEKRKNLFFCLTMFVLGLLSLAVLFLSYKFFRNDYVDIILEIVAWVFVWEAVDAFFLQRNEIRHQQLVLLKLFAAKIEIVKLRKNV